MRFVWSRGRGAHLPLDGEDKTDFRFLERWPSIQSVTFTVCKYTQLSGIQDIRSVPQPPYPPPFSPRKRCIQEITPPPPPPPSPSSLVTTILQLFLKSWLLKSRRTGRPGGSVGWASDSWVSAQVMISQFVSSSPALGSLLTVKSLLGILSLSLPLLSLSVSLSTQIHLKKN